MLDELGIDFKHQTEAGSLFRPAMDLRLILGNNVNDWSFEAAPSDVAASTCVLKTNRLTCLRMRVVGG